jgi:hypothetical protein
MYITDTEYNSFIQTDNLTAILGTANVDLCENIAVEEIKTYLRHRYDVEYDFRGIEAYDALIEYNGLDRVLYNGVVKYFTAPYPLFSLTTSYIVGDLAYTLSGGVYECVKNSVGYNYSDADYFVYNSTPSYAAGTVPTEIDDRNVQSIMYCIDISLYHLLTRIAPRNIPQHRIDRYGMALDWLKKIGKGEITCSFKLLEPEQGSRIVWDSDGKDYLDYTY